MNYTEFVQKSKTAKDKTAFVNKHLTKKYVSYAEKLAEASKIAEIATHIVIDGEKIYKKNTPLQYFLTFTRLVAVYTDIECGENDIVLMYDTLMESGLLPIILSCIPESEVTEFRTLVDMSISDIYENEHELTSFLDTKLKATGITVNKMLESLQETVASMQQMKGEDSTDNITSFPMNAPVSPNEDSDSEKEDTGKKND